MDGIEIIIDEILEMLDDPEAIKSVPLDMIHPAARQNATLAGHTMVGITRHADNHMIINPRYVIRMNPDSPTIDKYIGKTARLVTAAEIPLSDHKFFEKVVEEIRKIRDE